MDKNEDMFWGGLIGYLFSGVFLGVSAAILPRFGIMMIMIPTMFLVGWSTFGIVCYILERDAYFSCSYYNKHHTSKGY